MIFKGFFTLLLFSLIFCSCEKVRSDAVELEIDYSWGKRPGENRKNPEIRLTDVPPNTKFLKVQLVDLDLTFANHGEVEKIIYNGNNVIPYGSLTNYIGPTPPPQGHLYEYTVKALDEKGVVIGFGKKTKRCCQGTD